MITRARLRRWHVWLGWVVGLPILAWTVSGLVMVIRPIEEVRGEHLLRAPAPIRLTAPLVPPAIQGAPLKSLTLAQRAGGPRWVVVLEDGTTRLADPRTGALQPPLAAAEAMREVTSRYTGTAAIATVSRTDAANPPFDLRRPVATWQVAMDDGTRFYVDAGSGEVIARRTSWWRFYDWMWGLHIMDLKTREDTSNPLVIGFGLIALITTILALILLPTTIRRRRNPPA